MENQNQEHELVGIGTIFSFVLGGLAIFTLQGLQSRFTYRVVGKEVNPGRTIYFVSVLTGQNNTGDYSFLGTIFENGVYRHGRKSRISEESPSSVAWKWFYNRLTTGTTLTPCKFYHMGHCARCGRALTTPESIETGFGPVCATKVAA